MSKILVTGGCGYIGVHTIVDLVQNGFDVISVDNNSKSNASILEGAAQIIGKPIKNYAVDLCNLIDTEHIFEQNSFNNCSSILFKTNKLFLGDTICI